MRIYLLFVGVVTFDVIMVDLVVVALFLKYAVCCVLSLSCR